MATRIRKDVWKLGAGWNDTLLWYAKAVSILQARPITDPTSWRFLAAIHGMHPTVWRQFGVINANTALPPANVQQRFWNQCQHQSWYFLPWHRGYLAAFEQIVAAAVVDAGGPADWALPYWNYSDSTRPEVLRMPDAFRTATLPDGSANPLRVDRRYGSGQLHPDFVGLSALQHDDFAGGESDIPPGFGGPETVFHHGPESETTNGGLEALPHNPVHGLIGGVAPGTDPQDWRNLGLMSMPQTAALDPIFWLHHANIDRLWSVWLRDTQEPHRNPTETTWLDGPADRQFVMPQVNGEWTFTAREVTETEELPLDYKYDEEDGPILETRPARRLRKLGVPPGKPAPEEGPVADKPKPEVIGSSEGSVRVEGVTEAAVRLDRPSALGLKNNLETVATAGAAPAGEPARVFLKLEGICGTSDAAVYRVYVGLPPNANLAESRDRLAGTVSLFGVSAASNPEGPTAGSGINQVLEITEIVDALHLSGDDLQRLQVRFVPATEELSRANFSIAKITVFKL